MDATIVISGRRSVGPDTIAIEFESPPEFEARPGQFVRLSTTIDGEEHARFYTLSSPTVEDTFEVTVGIDPEKAGPFTELLATAEAGDELEVTGPFGDQYFEGEPRVVVLAGGPGVGPAVGIGERARDEGAEVAIVYQDDAPAHESRLASLRELGASVTITDGGIDAAVAEALTGRDGEQVFVYGFADFVADALAAVEAAGGDPDDAKVESFG
ncbi:MAG: FAD-dependent oxidoreductase [Halobacteriota archaeon]